MANVELGLVEGYYGKPWSWAERRAVVEALIPHGYRFFLYAPKADAFLRRRWQEPHPRAAAAELQAFSAFCRAAARFLTRLVWRGSRYSPVGRSAGRTIMKTVPPGIAVSVSTCSKP